MQTSAQLISHTEFLIRRAVREIAARRAPRPVLWHHAGHAQVLQFGVGGARHAGARCATASLRP